MNEGKDNFVTTERKAPPHLPLTSAPFLIFVPEPFALIPPSPLYVRPHMLLASGLTERIRDGRGIGVRVRGEDLARQPV